MNTSKIAIALLVTASMTSSVYAGDLNLSGGGNDSTTEFNQLNANNTSGLSLDGIQYTADISNPSSVSDAALEFDFSDTNLTSAVLQNTVIVNVDENGSLLGNGTNAVLSFEQLTSAGIASYKKLNNDTGIINTELDYAIRLDAAGADTNATYSIGSSNELSLTVFSTSGTPTAQDTATGSVTAGTTVDQFKFSCLGKYDALINFEDNADSFVSSGHGHSGDDIQDTLVFTIVNNDSGIADSVDGNGTEIIVSTDVNLTSLGFIDGSISLEGIQGSTTYPGTGAIINAGSDINFTITDAIPTGTSTWYATIGLSGTPEETTFAMASVNLEGNTTVNPAIDYVVDAPAGEWKNHAHIAQIPGTVAHANLSNKFYITNRSCKTVVPQFKLILDGVVTDVTDVVSKAGNSEIVVDSQEVYTLDEIIAKAGTAATGTYAVEIILPGIAEDYYIYAQSKNTELNQFKDLPVYNTSNRD